MSAPRQPRSPSPRKRAVPQDPRIHPLLGLDETALDGLADSALRNAKKALARVKKTAPQGIDALPLQDALEALLACHEFKHAAGIRVIAQALKLASVGLPAEHPMQTIASWSLILQASTEWHSKNQDGAWHLYKEAAETLAQLPTERARELGSYAVQQLIRMKAGGDLGEHDFDSARVLLEELMTSVEQRFSAYVRNRALEATEVWVCNHEELKEDNSEPKENDLIIQLCNRALALPRDQPNAHTWTFVLHLLGRRALAYREQKRLIESQKSCAEVLPLLPHATLPRAREHAAWALAEGAFVAADLRARPDEARPFLQALRSLFSPPRNHVEASELAYGIAMEARCALLLQRPEEAADALDALGNLATKFPRSDGVHTAIVAGKVLRGDWLRLQGRPLEAHEVWRAVAKEYADDPEPARKAEAKKAVERMQQG